MENFAIGVLEDEFGVAIKDAAEAESELERSCIEELTDKSADELDKIEEASYWKRRVVLGVDGIDRLRRVLEWATVLKFGESS